MVEARQRVEEAVKAIRNSQKGVESIVVPPHAVILGDELKRNSQKGVERATSVLTSSVLDNVSIKKLPKGSRK